jgi:hypothetical protein
LDRWPYSTPLRWRKVGDGASIYGIIMDAAAEWL